MESFLRRTDAFGHGADLKTFTQEAKLGGKREKKKIYQTDRSWGSAQLRTRALTRSGK